MALGVRGQADGRESIGRPFPRVVGLDPPKREGELDVLARGEKPREARCLPDDGDAVAPERCPCRAVLLGHDRLAEANFAVVGNVETGEEREQRRLARA